ncbi:uncharacterized protein EV154DRAFT_427164 [Mucor mucedo]|uniref:uncharacterized protein n=1 Tax=Mucor mucedo TaxID=29922 RepID=UPI0022201675|nr:uncharacterized protein EV154DRAFT_427164 [Mucor mucedo]KAI7887580.1 hypothetical protein EV154DRAFT_427164 [Mucor mucedo]
MPKGKPLKTRVLGLPKGYKYKEWLDSQLNVDEPFIDYFKFADTFDGSESATNYHYADLLEKLSSGQSNKLTKIASIAKTLYNSRKLNSKFGKRYEEYWKMKNEDIKLQRTMRTQNQQTVLRLKELTIKHIPHFAQMVILQSKGNNNIEVSAEDEFTEDSITQRVMTQTTNLPSTVRVGDLKIIDLSLQIAEEMLKAETSAAQFESIMKASKIDLNPMSVQANTLIKVGNKMIAPGLVEFSGGINDKTSSRKNAKDIEKLYTNMLVHYDGVMYRTVDVVVDIPNTPRKLVAYVNQIPSILAWKEALINHALDLN